MPQTTMPKTHHNVRIAKGNAVVLTQSLLVAHQVACEDDPVLALVLADMLKVVTRAQDRLAQLVTFHDEQRKK